jgi:predicted heme/steroid binding protein
MHAAARLASVVVALIGLWVALFVPSSGSIACPTSVKAALAWTRSAFAGRCLLPRSGGGSGAALFSVAELAAYDGTDPGRPILLAFGRDVFDVTEGARFYGVGAPYHSFAGRDGTRALTLGSLRPEDVASRDVSDFTEAQRAAMAQQHEFYRSKYPRVGTLID